MKLTLRMSDDVNAQPPTRAASFGNIKFFLLGLFFDIALVCGFFLISILASLVIDCTACESTDFYGRVEYGFMFASTITLGLLLYFWYILIPISALPPIVGFILDYRRYEHRCK